MDGSCDIQARLRRARKLLLQINEMGLPAATELLETITPQYVNDLLSWAAILLSTNLVAIKLGAALVFRLFEVNASRHREGLPVWGRRFIMLLFLLMVLLSAPLLSHRIELKKTGQNRPLQYPVAAKVREAVKEYMSSWPNVELMTLGRNSVEPESGITIILMSEIILPPEFEEGLIKVVQKARGGDPVVRIFPVLAAR